LGSKILGSLRGAGFNVTAIQRKGSDKKVPEGVPSIQADLASKADLVSAFKGQDVVIRYIWIHGITCRLTVTDVVHKRGTKPGIR
jgi:putative NADH-flavin reductase